MKKTVANLVLFCISVMILGSGCAANRGILDVRLNQASNPATGRAVTITRVTDQRVFEMAPGRPSIPSLKGKEINDKSITLRAIARKRNSYGKALGDILLPEGRTVEHLVREALTISFQDAGYRVVKDAEGVEAIPIEADIEQFWSWMTPGFWAVSLEFEAKVRIKGAIPPFEEGEVVRGYILLHTQAAGTRAWSNTINKGIKTFVDESKKRLGAQ